MPISVYTEMNDATAAPPRGWILYDAQCQFCLRCVRFLRPILALRSFLFAPLDTPWVRRSLRLSDGELFSEMRLLLPDGEVFSGADAIIEVAKYVWWARPLVALARIPGVRRAMRAGYRWVAANRSCMSDACSVRPQKGMGVTSLTEARRHEIQ
jgi:predicted DCC family thiol-disulfide oxidoreductase YuxK